MSSLHTITRVSKSSLRRHAVSFSSSTSTCGLRCLHRWATSELRTGVVLDQHAARPLRHSNSRRAFSTTASTRAALAQHPPTKQSVLVAYPSPSSVEETDEDADDPDVDFVPPEEAKLEITDRAAEQLRSLANREHNPNAALRIAVESGGCHGYQYKLELAKKRQEDDYHFSHPTVKPSNIYVDAVSMALLKGSAIDFATELIGSSFRVIENPQAKGGSCGCGVSWELKI
ncbi:uncharacterized protein B0H18DRAFT_1048215 [Fomitopsis serialis]|uniref:uncharacterized protein n=1 Tax=Fomitopsis serialis TaxID=139415 RepID=UPI00200796CF|nr:uncharacterized protein B0H18DRAFT_1048215 [Neoantrodia serialis]KAH9913507.1 hypothetical protein B0H18DRAFT_1048215 [Neoantrodia serialis]